MFERFLEKLSFKKKLTRDRFAKTLIKRLNAASGVKTVEYESDAFRLVVDGQQYVNLANFYDEHIRLDKTEREEHIGNILQGIFQSGFELPAEFEDAQHDLLPKIWPRGAFDRLNLQAQIEGRDPINFAHVPIGQHLYLGLVYDLPKSVRTVGPDELTAWEVTLEEALDVAIDNLRSRPMTVGKLGPEEEDTADDDSEQSFTPPAEYGAEPEQRSIDPDGRVYLFVANDSYDATRLVLIHELHQMELAGRPVALAPNRDALLVAGSEDQQGLLALATLASNMYEGEPRSHVPIPLTYNEDGEWTEYHVTKEQPAYDLFHALELKYLAEEYNEQKPLLEKLYEEQYLKSMKPVEPIAESTTETSDGPPFVASLLVAESEGRYESHAVWAEDLNTLLPKADIVAFMKQSENAAPIQIPWRDVMAVLDDLVTEVPETYPPRWQVKEFPSDLALNILTEEDDAE